MTIQSGSSDCGVNSEDYLWRFYPGSYNFNPADDGIGNSIFGMFNITSVPDPLPLPENLRVLLQRKTVEEFFSEEDMDRDWVHTHFSEFYEEKNRGSLPLFGGDGDGAIYIEPSTIKNRILFCGRGDLACFYFLDL